MFKRKGENLDYTCTADVEHGEVVVINDALGVAASTAKKNDVIAVYMTGVFLLPKDTSTELQQKVYWDTAAKKVTVDANDGAESNPTAYLEAGIVWETALTSADKVQVKIG
jgi:predicted RecA/RadA family phage recombinase